MAWAINAAAAARDTALNAALTDALNQPFKSDIAMPPHIPPPPATDVVRSSDAFRDRVARALHILKAAHLTRQPNLEGFSPER